MKMIEVVHMGKILGISDAGDFEDVICIDDLMQPIKTNHFRSLYHKRVYIRCPEIVKNYWKWIGDRR